MLRSPIKNVKTSYKVARSSNKLQTMKFDGLKMISKQGTVDNRWQDYQINTHSSLTTVTTISGSGESKTSDVEGLPNEDQIEGLKFLQDGDMSSLNEVV